MALYDRVKVTTATTGTGTITLGSGVRSSTAGDYLSFAEAGVPDGAQVVYFIQDGNNWARGKGTYTASGTTLGRDAAEENWDGSTLAAGALSLSGSAVVYISPRAVDIITDWTAATDAASPNDAVPAVSLLPNNDADDVDAVIGPKGVGALQSQVADGTATGGDKRGENAVDFQIDREDASFVASGDNSVIAGGFDNTASGDFSAVGGGRNNIASGYSSVVGGGGDPGSTASGDNSTVAGGAGNVASGEGSAIPGGRNATDRGISGVWAFGGDVPLGNGLGQVQVARYLLGVETTDDTPTVPTTDGGDESATNAVCLPNYAAYTFVAYVTAYRVDATGGMASYKLEGAIMRGADASSTAIVGSVAKTIIAETNAGWDVAATANTTIGCLEFTVTGEAAKDIVWLIDAQTVELTRDPAA